MDQSGGGEEIMDHSLEVYNCSLKEAWKKFLARMAEEHVGDIDEIVFVYDKDDDVAWAVESCKLDDFAEELWDNCSLWEKARDDDPFEDFVIIQLTHWTQADKETYPAAWERIKWTRIPGIARDEHHFTVDYSPSFGSTV